MDTKQRIEAAVIALAASRPADRISLADVAQAAGVSIQSVRRHIGDKQALREIIAQIPANERQTDPDTRSRILQAARRVFARQGYTGATLDQVAGEAGLTKGAVYWHFSSKAEVFLALLQLSHHGQRQDHGTWAEGALTESTLTRWLEDRLTTFVADPDAARLFWEFFAQSREPGVEAELRVVWRGFLQAIEGLVRDLQQRGALTSEVDPYVVACMVDALLNGLVVAWLVDPERNTPDQWAPHIARLLWYGLRPKEEGKK